MKFYKCEKCGKIAVLFRESQCPTKCCGEAMVEIVPGTVDAAREKHIPDIVKDGSVIKISVGSVEHPMLDAKKDLKPGDKPYAEFVMADGEELVAAYESCNLHGIWKAEA